MLNHTKYIEQCLKNPISKIGVLKVGINFNMYFDFSKAEKYAMSYAADILKQKKNITKPTSRQLKSSADAILGKLAEEVIIYLLISHFRKNNFNYIITNNKTENETVKQIVSSLRIERKLSGHEKHFDSDILIYNQDSFQKIKRIFILSVKGTTRERIGQFLSHLFLMDKDVINAKYGKDKYEIIFTKENTSLKYAFVTLDWAVNKDFIKHTSQGRERKTVKSTEVQLILDDVKLGGGIYVLNNCENIDGIGNFASLVGKICDYLK